jgi:hypothetical protein
MATGYGGGLGLWMGCIDATAFAGVSFYAKGSSGNASSIGLSLTMEETTIPDPVDPRAAAPAPARTTHARGRPTSSPVTANWTLFQVPWAMFTAGDAAGVAVPADGHNIAGFSFTAAAAYVAVDETRPEGEYMPVPSPYELVIDDVGFY